VPGSEHGNAQAIGRPDGVPANDNASANAGGPPADVPGGPPDDHPGKGNGPRDDVPVNDHAAPHAGSPNEPDATP
jgi:hypothetical protein